MRNRKGSLALAAAVVVLGVAGLRGRLRRYEIVEASMEPQLHSGDYIVAQATSEGHARGDIVILPHPEIARLELIKRIVGLPGEVVSLRSGQVHINGLVLAESWADGPVRGDGEWQLGATEVFVLGDNRPMSAADSRTIGLIDTRTIKWKAVARYWPPGRTGRLATGSSGR